MKCDMAFYNIVTGSSSEPSLSELEISLLLAAIDEAEHFEKE